MSDNDREKAIERERVAEVFGLAPDDLHTPDPRFPDEWDGVFAYWYEGVPYSDADREYIYRTAIVNEAYGACQTPEGWERVAAHTNSGETDCPGNGLIDKSFGVRCYLCETEFVVSGDHGSHPGTIYIGEGWVEVVFRRPYDDDDE